MIHLAGDQLAEMIQLGRGEVYAGHTASLFESGSNSIGEIRRVQGRISSESPGNRFDWRSKRDAMRIRLEEDGSLVTFLILLRAALAEGQGYKPANFDRLIEIAGGDSEFETIDERLLLEAQPDFMPWLPRE